MAKLLTILAVEEQLIIPSQTTHHRGLQWVVQENITDKPVILKGRSISRQKAIASPNQESIELY